MPHLPSAQAFSDAAAALYTESPLSRTSIKYRVDSGSAVLTLRATNNARVRLAFSIAGTPSVFAHAPPAQPKPSFLQTLAYSGRTRDDLRYMDRLSLLALNSCFGASAAAAEAAAAAAAAGSGGGGGGSSGASAPRPPPAGSGAQRRKAARALAASAGGPPKAPRVKSSRQRARERAAVRREERKMAAGAGGSPAGAAGS
jgi:hypothetical protein